MLKREVQETAKQTSYVLKCVQVNCDVSAHVALAKAAPLRQFSQPICENGDIIT